MAPLPKIYFERLLENSPDIVIAVDAEGMIIFYNDGAQNTLGYSATELRGKPVSTIYETLDHARAVMAGMKSDKDGFGKVKNFESSLRTRTGEIIPVAISGSLINDDEGRPVGSIGFAKDLREIRHRDQVVTLAELCVSLFHEINNPLETIENQLELVSHTLEQKCSDDEMVVEGDRVDAIERELRKIQQTLESIQKMASAGRYGTREYLPGRLMTDLRDLTAEDLGEIVARKKSELADGGASGGEADDEDVTANARNGGLEGVRVLVVDDDLGVCHSLRDVLLEEGCVVRTATSGLEALRLLDVEKSDIVLSDVVMPDMDGYDLYMDLRERMPDLPVILMTAYYFDKDHVIKRSRLEGLDQVIFKKPIKAAKLKAILRSTLEERGVSATA